MKYSVLIKLTTQVILVENEGGQSIFTGGTRSWKITIFITYATHCQHDYKVTGGLEWAKKVCVCYFCMFSVSLKWTGLPLMIYIWLLLWQSLTKTMFGHSCLPREHPTPSQLPLHSVKNGQQILIGTYFYPEDSITNTESPLDRHMPVFTGKCFPSC